MKCPTMVCPSSTVRADTLVGRHSTLVAARTRRFVARVFRKQAAQMHGNVIMDVRYLIYGPEDYPVFIENVPRILHPAGVGAR